MNRSPGAGYVTRWEDFHFCDGIEDALRAARERGYLTVLVTSQRCVGKGLLTYEDLEALHAKMQERLGPSAAFDAIHAFTGLPGSEHLEKPKPGLILEAAAALSVDLEASWLIGDHDRDIQMALAAGVPSTIRVVTHHSIGVEATHTLSSTTELASLLGQCLGGTAPD